MTNTRSRISTCALGLCFAATLAGVAAPAHADQTVAKTDDYQLNFDFSGVAGDFHSQHNYLQSGTKSAGGSTWQEGYITYGFNGFANVGGGQMYGAFNLLTSGTWGEGDAAGFSNGSERTTAPEDAYVGWRSGDLFPALGKNGLDISVGRQTITVGNGFLISGDALNLGRGILDGELNRGGAYYLAARRSFAESAKVSVGGEKGWRGDVMWLKSKTRVQSDATMAVGNLEHVADWGTLGLTYIKVTNVNQNWAFLHPQRNGMKTTTVRFRGNAGIPDLLLAGEYASQDQRHGNERAGYATVGWTFSSLPWSPQAKYRFSRFSANFDSLFYGLPEPKFGTWFQGEVAGNYAGPFNSNARIQMLEIDAAPSKNIFVSLMSFKFNTLNKQLGNLDARETDLYAAWTVNDHLTVIPLVGLYKPSVSVANGGSQLGSARSNLYTELLLAFSL